MPQILQYTPLRTLSMFQCWREFPFLILSGNKVVCASGDDQRSVCRGDSGGPLATDDGKLVGITSFINTEGCEDGLAQGFTRVSSYLKWIKTETGISCEK